MFPRDRGGRLMPGKHVTDRQVRRYMNSRKRGVHPGGRGGSRRFQRAHGAAVRGSIRCYRASRTGPGATAPARIPSPRSGARSSLPLLRPCRTSARHDAARAAAASSSRPLPERLLRSLQRRVAHWRATEGPERELIFRQEHPPGRQALSDFTDGSGARRHPRRRAVPASALPFLARLSAAGNTSRRSAAARASPPLPKDSRKRSGSSAACRANIAPTGSRRPTATSSSRRTRPRAMPSSVATTSMEPTRNNAGVSHENGSVEAAHGHLKSGLARGARAARLARLRRPRRLPGLPPGVYRRARTPPRRDVLAIELAALVPLPAYRTRTTASQPRHGDALGHDLGAQRPLHRALAPVGCRLKVHVYDDRLVCYLGTTPVLTVARRHFKRDGPRVRVVDYRHLIGSAGQEAAGLPPLGVPRRAVPAPGLPARLGGGSTTALEPRKACRVYVGLLHLAAMHGCEAALADHLAAVLDAGGSPDLEAARAAVAPPAPSRTPARARSRARSGRLRPAAACLATVSPDPAA